jgi:lysozyme family protein
MDFDTASNSEFDKAFHKLLGHEGSYSNHKQDRGGETMWGVTERVARANNYYGSMKDLPVEKAKEIYKKDYWNPIRADELPASLRYLVFDAAVNSGVVQSIKWLQAAVGVQEDGVIGRVTLAACNALEPHLVARRMLAARLEFMSSLSTWPSFGRGWARRISSLLKEI